MAAGDVDETERVLRRLNKKEQPPDGAASRGRDRGFVAAIGDVEVVVAR